MNLRTSVQRATVMRSATTAARGLVAALAITTASCAAEDPGLTVRYAPGFTPARSTVSVFGVFLNGRMSPEAWGWFGPSLTKALGGTPCEAVFGDQLQQSDPALFDETDTLVKSDGITDAMLDRFTPRASGDLVLVITVHGRVRNAKEPGDDHRAARPQQRPPGPFGPGRRHAGATAERGLTLSAIVFSRRLHQSVGRLSMRYMGTSLDQAINRFTQQLGAEMPAATCRGWTWEAQRSEHP